MNGDVLRTRVVDGIAVITLGSARRIYLDEETGYALTEALDGFAPGLRASRDLIETAIRVPACDPLAISTPASSQQRGAFQVWFSTPTDRLRGRVGCERIFIAKENDRETAY